MRHLFEKYKFIKHRPTGYDIWAYTILKTKFTKISRQRATLGLTVQSDNERKNGTQHGFGVIVGGRKLLNISTLSGFCFG